VQHVIDVVVQLLPRAIQSTPAAWSRVQSYSLYQWKNQPLQFEFPAQLAGKVHAQGALSFLSSYPSTGTRYPFNGYIDEVAVFNTALSAVQILLINTTAIAGDPTGVFVANNPVAYWRMNEAAGTYNTFDSAGANNGLYISAKPGQAPRPFNTAVKSTYFDGVNDHVQCSNLDIAGNLTVLAWFNPSVLTNDMRIVSKARGESDAEQCWKMSIEQVGLTHRLTFGVMASGRYREAQGTGTLLPNTWYFAAATFNGNQIQLYLNGVLVDTRSNNGTLATDATAPIMIGDSPPGSARCRLLHDLYQAKLNNVGDGRPVTQSWDAPSGQISATDTNLLQDDLKVTVNTVAVDNSPPATFPISATTYQLFPGGLSYSIPVIPNTLRNTQLLPDPVTNPLGLFRCSSDLRIRDNVTVQGTILLTGGTSYNLDMDDDNVTWIPVDLLTIQGDALPRQMPIGIVPNDWLVEKGCANVNMRGQIVVGNLFELQNNDVTTSARLQGSCVCGQMKIDVDDRYPTSTTTWKSHLLSYIGQRSAMGGVQYFPLWLCNNQSLDVNPRLVITPELQNRIYHWPDFSRAIYQPHPADPGLRWQIVAWNDKH